MQIFIVASLTHIYSLIQVSRPVNWGIGDLSSANRLRIGAGNNNG